MIVLFKGTDKSKNYSPQALALCAGLSAVKFYKKTLILQFTTKYPVEGYMIGKRIADQSLGDGTYVFEDNGIDALTRRAGFSSFTEEHFANAVIPAVNARNLLDIMPVSQKTEDDFRRELMQTGSTIQAIVTSAAKIYDNIFVLVNGKDKELVEAVIPYVDKSVTCVSQGIKEEISAPDCKKNYFLVTDYDYKSTYSLRAMQKEYGGITYMMPYNVEFKDHYTDKDMLQFILHNTDPDKSNYSFRLISEMCKFTKMLLAIDTLANMNNSEDIPDYNFTKISVEKYLNNDVKVLSGDDCDVKTTHHGLFGKKVKKSVRIITDDMDEEKPQKKGFFKSQEEKAEIKQAKADKKEADAKAAKEKKDAEIKAKEDAKAEKLAQKEAIKAEKEAKKQACKSGRGN